MATLNKHPNDSDKAINAMQRMSRMATNKGISKMNICEINSEIAVVRNSAREKTNILALR